ncbi:tumor necrosis factor receptor superfamily member 5-like isoform X2 [Silurus meridionalis]|uniref:tumor necrosis factor receptor superfamily member 5-like isoform X2 n=1 Tax=Silurus meridionalis TaxID=175797 RepID=UPI001EE9C02B|nr:tumor necrosis factor receptor superfamily member 5-like isoform X2 [Silurus meridionalis]
MTCPNDMYEHNSKCCNKCQKDHHLQTVKNCTAESNTICMCMEGFYCTQSVGHKDECGKCEPVRRCPPGHGVSFPPNSKSDTLCKACPAGTFNNNTDYITPCRNHTSCLDLGRKLVLSGTAKTDAICGDFIPSCPKSYWMLPAGLWAGLILTLILVIIGFTCRKCKRKRNAVITMVNSQNFVPPALPPDVIKYPRSPELQKLTNSKDKDCAVEDDYALECDGVSLNMFPEKCVAFSIPVDINMSISEPYKSEPQEDDWPAL